jgi:hypothetical protein
MTNSPIGGKSVNPGKRIRAAIMILNIQKAKIALLVCVALIFRILFVNLGPGPSTTGSHSNRLVPHHFQAGAKRRTHFESQGQGAVECEAAEFCEEEKSNNDIQPEAPPFFLIRILRTIGKIEVKSFSFSSAFANTQSSRFLVLQVIRV